MQPDHALEARGCHQERAKVVPGKEKRNHESSVHPAKRWPRIRGARRGIVVEHEQMAQKLFEYEAAQVLLSVNGAKDAFDPDRVKSLLPTARSAKRLKVTKTLDAGDA